MTPLAEFIFANVERGACRCGRCVDHVANPDAEQPKGHTADLYFFEVALRKGSTPDPEVLKRLLQEHEGSFKMDPFDGKDHSYIEVGAWIGDQGAALMLIGLGQLLGLWHAVTPKVVPSMPKKAMDSLAGQGYISLVPFELARELFGLSPLEPVSTTAPASSSEPPVSGAR